MLSSKETSACGERKFEQKPNFAHTEGAKFPVNHNKHY